MKTEYKSVVKPKDKKLYRGVDAKINTLIGKIKNLFISKKELRAQAKRVYEYSLELKELSDLEIEERILEAKRCFRLSDFKKEEFEKSFALVVEVIFRVEKKRAYEVQIMGALALVRGYLIEMSTGEGKSLTATLAATVLGCKRGNVHIITSNDYLAKRDALGFEKIYKSFGLNVSYVIGSLEPDSRKKAYSCEVVYTTSKEVLADFLRDKMQNESHFTQNRELFSNIKNSAKKSYFLRGLECAIVDEADSVLADDATTPLIISSKKENRVLKESVLLAKELAKEFKKDEDYTVHERFLDVSLKDGAKKKLEELCADLNNLWRVKQRREFLIKQALVARELFHLNKEYIIKDGKVMIVDEKSGRVMSERSWSNGLHQAIEAKEGLELTDPTVTFAKLSFQRFFRFYKNLCGMSGTLSNLKDEFWQIYDLKMIKIPTRKASKMSIYPDRIFFDEKEKKEALASHIIELHKSKRPILVGLGSVKESEEFSLYLRGLGVENITLNALYDELEAMIIKDAGELEKITIATNMAGRGTDIFVSEEVESLGGLHVVTTKRDKSRRVDLQFFGRAARQGQKGSAICFLSLEDEILKNYTPKWLMRFISKNFKQQWAKSLALFFYRFYQKKVERDISKYRETTLFREFFQEESMSFRE